MARVLVIGGADQGRQVIDVFAAAAAAGTAHAHEVVGVLDGNHEVGALVAGVAVCGGSDDLAAQAAALDADGYVVAIGDNAARGRVHARCRELAPGLLPVIARHPAAIVAGDATVGGGSILLAGSVVSNGCAVGEGVLLGTNSSIDHDCTVGDHVSLAPGAATGGTVRIGSTTALGVHASIAHGITIGAHTVVGAGAVVLADLPDLVVAYGVPARIGRKRTVGEPYLRRDDQPPSDPMRDLTGS